MGVDALRISPNFTLREFVRSQTASRLGIDNRPSTEVLINLVYLSQAMEMVRKTCGNKPVTVSSGYRSKALNAEIGGATNSDHIEGRACDFIVSGMSNRDVFALIKHSKIPYSKLILEFPDSLSGGWIHLSIAPMAAKVDRVNLVATRKGGRTHYEPA